MLFVVLVDIVDPVELVVLFDLFVLEPEVDPPFVEFVPLPVDDPFVPSLFMSSPDLLPLVALPFFVPLESDVVVVVEVVEFDASSVLPTDVLV